MYRCVIWDGNFVDISFFYKWSYKCNEENKLNEVIINDVMVYMFFVYFNGI